MDRTSVCYLVSYVEGEQDEIGQEISLEKKRKVFCDVSSVSGSETFDAGRNNIVPECKVTIFAPEYESETVVILDNTRYGVYRTYWDKKYDTMELYLSKKVGV